MERTTHPRVKVCCISSADELAIAVRSGVNAVGLVSAMPNGPGIIDDDLIAHLTTFVPPGVASFLLTSRTDSAEIVAQQRHARTNTLQIVDRVDVSVYRALRETLPGIAFVQVLHIAGREAVDEAVDIAGYVDALLLDSGNVYAGQRNDPSERTLGGTGRVHDWRVSRAIREAVAIPIYLAGGLNPVNVAEAIAEVGPFGVDVCSGVRTDGRLDAEKVAGFIRAARKV